MDKLINIVIPLSKFQLIKEGTNLAISICFKLVIIDDYPKGLIHLIRRAGIGEGVTQKWLHGQSLERGGVQ